MKFINEHTKIDPDAINTEQIARLQVKNLWCRK